MREGKRCDLVVPCTSGRMSLENASLKWPKKMLDNGARRIIRSWRFTAILTVVRTHSQNLSLTSLVHVKRDPCTSKKLNTVRFWHIVRAAIQTKSFSSRHLMASFFKQDRYVKVSSKRFQLTLMSDWVAEMIEGGKTGLPFSDFFGSDVLLVPAPRSSLMRAGTLWVPERIAAASLRRRGWERSLFA